MNTRIISAGALAAVLGLCASNQMSAAVQPATPVSQVAPNYSRDLRVDQEEGEVVVGFTITAEGKVLNPVVVSSTNRLLNKPTLEAIRKWKFAPATNDGVAVSVNVLQPVAFTIPYLHDETTDRLVTSKSKTSSRS
jgi:protein TonB